MGQLRRQVSLMAAAAAIVTALAGGSAFAAPAAPDPTAEGGSGSIGMRLLDAPVASRDDPRARVYIVDHLAPGTTIDRRIEVSNTTAAPLRVALYPAAAAVSDGTFLGAAGRTPNELSSWTKVEPAGLDIPPGGRVTANVQIDVPRDAAPGEQYAAVWAEASSGKDAGGVTQVSRVGLRLYVSVGPGGPPAADFRIDNLSAQRDQDGTASVLASVHNTGGRAVDMSGTLHLSEGPGGISAGPFPAELGTTLATGATEPVTIVLDEALPTGRWKARITLRSGLLEREAVAEIVVPAAGDAAPPAVSTSIPSERPPYAVLAVAGLVVVAAAAAAPRLGRLVRRRQGPVGPGRHGGRRA